MADGAKLRMAFEVRQTVTQGGRNINRIDVASSDDGIQWGTRRTILSPGDTSSWNAEVGTPDLLWDGSSWAVLFHANQHSQPNRPGRYVRALARGGRNFTDPFNVTGAVLGPQSTQQYPTQSWFDYGPGLGDIVSENGIYYQVFEGFAGLPDCGKAQATPRLGLARSTDLVNWDVSAASPFQEISQDGKSCGHDMPNWQRLASGEQTIVTTNDPPDAAPPVRWRIVAGAPAPAPSSSPDRLSPNQFLSSGRQLKSTSGYSLVMQGDGNLVLVAPDGRARWASGTDGHPGAIASMQSDGNMVVIGPGNVALWSTGTGGRPGAVLVMQGDGNAVVYGPGNVALWASGTAPAGTTPTDRLAPSQALSPGQRLVTTNGYALVMQGDGNLVLVAPGGRPIWATGTDGHNGAIAAMQSDGNFVVIGPGNVPLWWTGTGGHAGAVLVLQSDANLVVYGPGNVALWSSNTRAG